MSERDSGTANRSRTFRLRSPRLSARSGFGIAPILYMLGLVGVGAGVLFSGYSQILRSNVQMTNDLATKNDLNANATTLAATSVLSTDTTKLCPPQGGSASADCAAAVVKMAALSGQAQLPANSAIADDSGTPAEVGVFTAGSGLKQMDGYGHYYIYCRWENPTSPGDGPAFAILSAGPDGTLNTECGDVSAQGDDLMISWPVMTAVNRSAVWQAVVDGGGSTTQVQFGQVGNQLVVDNVGNLTVPGTLNVTGTTTLAAVTTGAISATTGNFSSTLAAGASTLNSAAVTNNATVGGTLGVTGDATFGGAVAGGAGTFSSMAVTNNATVGGTLGVTGTTTLGVLSAGASTLNSAAITSNATVGGTLGVTGDATFGAAVAGGDATFNALGVTTNAVVGGTLEAGDTVLGSAAVSNNATVGGTLGVTGTSSFGGAMSGSGATFSGTVTAANFSGPLTGNATNVSGVVAIANGGTGATTAPTARSNLGANDAANLTTGVLDTNRFATNSIPGGAIQDGTVGALQLESTTVTPGAYNWGTVDADGRVTYATNVSTNILSDGDGQTVTLDSDGITFTTGGVDQAILDENGYLGLGTTEPNERLDLVGNIRIEGAAGASREIQFTTGATSKRWVVSTNGTAEGGSDAGSDFAITHFDDSGNSLGTAVSIERATGNTTFGGTVTAGTFVGDLVGNVTGTISGGIALGTQASTTNPQRSGDVTTGFFTSGANTVNVAAGGIEVMRWNTVASGVDYVSVTPGKSGTNVKIAVAGATANQTLDLVPAGTGNVNILTGALHLGGVNGLWQDTAGFTTAVGATSLPSTNFVDGSQFGGIGNTAVGYIALNANTTGGLNTAVGGQALAVNTEGIGNTAVGTAVLNASTTGNFNTGLGAITLMGNTVGAENTAVGAAAMQENDTGSNNTAIGAGAMNKGVGSQNTILGSNAGANISGSNNTLIGYSVGATTLQTGSGNILIGTSSAVDTAAAGTNYALNLGNLLRGDMTNSDATYNTTLFLQSTASGVNYLQIAGAAAAAGPTLSAQGTDSDIDINFTPKGAGVITMVATSALTLPGGTTGQQPSGVDGMIRYNSDTPAIEAYYNSTWQEILTSGGGVGTVTLGTDSANTNPQRSGDATTGFFTSGANTVNVAAGGIEVMRWNTVASGVDYVSVTPGKSGTNVKIAVAGATANQTLDLAPAGTGNVNILTGALHLAGVNGLWQDTTNYNMAVGATALPSTLSQAGGGTNGQSNTALGYQALNANTTGYANMALGALALAANTEGSGNVAIGAGALLVNDTGQANIAVGSSALSSNTGGTFNLALGIRALESNTTGGGNIALGFDALKANDTGSASIAIGHEALILSTGERNLAIGPQVGSTILATGSNNILIGTSNAVDTAAAGTNYALNVGNLLRGDMTNSDATYNTTLFLQSTASGVNYLQVAGAAAGAGPVLSAQGTDSDIDMTLTPKGEGVITMVATSALKLPAGTTGQQPSGVDGMVRYNSSITGLEAYYNSTWNSLLSNNSTITNSVTLGTQASTTNPSRSGDVTTGFFTSGANTVNVAAGGIEVMRWNTVASGVDYVSVTPGKSGTNVKIAVAGATANQTLDLAPAGTGNVNILTGALHLAGANGLWQDVTNYNTAVSATGFPSAISQAGGGTNGQYNVALGVEALNANTTGAFNSAIGAQALLVNTTGLANTALGAAVLVANTEGAGNTAVGATAMTSNTTGGGNTAIGAAALQSNTTGGNNTAVGSTALNANTEGNENVALGVSALGSSTTGANNTAIGAGALQSVTTGAGNTALGHGVGSSTLETGIGNILIGTSSAVDTAAAGTNYALNLGNLLRGDMTNSDATYNTTLFLQSTASGVNYLQIAGAAAAAGPTLSAQGTDSDIDINFTPKGAGVITMVATSALTLPGGTTGQQPAGVDGMIRYNSTTTGLEAYYNSTWNNLLSSNSTITSSIALGTQASTTNPSRSGDVTTGFFTSGANTVNVAAGGIEVMRWNTVASGVDYVSVTPGKSGTNVKIAVAGATANQTLDLAPAGTGNVNILTGALHLAGVNGLWQDTTNFNIAVGATALPSTLSQAGGGTNGQNNAAFGYQALNANTTGQGNTALGVTALKANTTGAGNTAVGTAALTVSTVGNANTAVGALALGANTTGATNTAVGYVALTSNTTGTGNTALGSGALSSNTTGTANVGVGGGAGNKITTGTNNTALGYAVATTTLTTGTHNILIGTSSAVDTAAAGTNYSLNVGNLLRGDMTNSDATYNTTLFLQSTASGVNYLQVAGAAAAAGPTLSAQGTDTDIAINITPKGAGVITMNATTALKLPAGTTGQQPTGVDGMVRYNSTTTGLEAYYNTTWNTLLSSNSTITNSITLGTQASTTNPQRSGDATTGFFTSGANTVNVAAGGIEVMRWNTIASGVDYLSITPGKSGTAVKIAVAGSTTPQHLNLAPVGAAGVLQFNGSTVLWQDATNFNIAVGATAAPSTISQTGGGSNGQNNTALGYQALNANTTGALNTAVGTGSLKANTVGYGNVAVGSPIPAFAIAGALGANTTGVNNTAVGSGALGANTTGVSNTAVGAGALMVNSTGISNTAVGTLALFVNSTGVNNTALGSGALAANTTGTDNTAAGYNALTAATTGIQNTSLGSNAGAKITTGTNNVAIGYGVGSVTLTTGTNNILIGTSSTTDTVAADTTSSVGIGTGVKLGNGEIGIGYQAMQGRTSGGIGGNVAIGAQALYSNTTGAGNLAIGPSALHGNTTGTGNLAIGISALYGNTTGTDNVAIGGLALTANTTGVSNTAIGAVALSAVTTGTKNTAIGAYVASTTLATGTNNILIGTDNTTDTVNDSTNNTVAIGTGVKVGTGDVGIGYQALNKTTMDSRNNVAVGYQALKENTTGISNTAVGYTALAANTTGLGNTAVGAGALTANSGGFGNTAFGVSALAVNTVNYNTGIGASALVANTTGTGNTAVGVTALGANTTGSSNTAVGIGALGSNSTGSNNVGLGHSAGNKITTGSNNVAIGMQVGSTTLTTGSNNILIGVSSATDTAASGTSNTLMIKGTGSAPILTATATDTTAPLAVFGGTGALTLPTGTSGTRPGTPVAGMIRYNSTTPGLEAYYNSTWNTLGASGGLTSHNHTSTSEGGFYRWVGYCNNSGSDFSTTSLSFVDVPGCKTGTLPAGTTWGFRIAGSTASTSAAGINIAMTTSSAPTSLKTAYVTGVSGFSQGSMSGSGTASAAVSTSGSNDAYLQASGVVVVNSAATLALQVRKVTSGTGTIRTNMIMEVWRIQ